MSSPILTPSSSLTLDEWVTRSGHRNLPEAVTACESALAEKANISPEEIAAKFQPLQQTDQRFYPACLMVLRHQEGITGKFAEALRATTPENAPGFLNSLLQWAKIESKTVFEGCWDFFERNRDRFSPASAVKLPARITQVFGDVERHHHALPQTWTRFEAYEAVGRQSLAPAADLRYLERNPSLDQSAKPIVQWFENGGKRIPHRFIGIESPVSLDGASMLPVEDDGVDIAFLDAADKSEFSAAERDVLRFLERLAKLDFAENGRERGVLERLAQLPSSIRGGLLSITARAFEENSQLGLLDELIKISRTSLKTYPNFSGAIDALEKAAPRELDDGLFVVVERIKNDLPIDPALIERLQQPDLKSFRESETRSLLERTTRSGAEKPLEEMKADFTRDRGPDGSVVTPETFDRIAKLYEQVHSRGQTLSRLDDEQLKSYVADVLMEKVKMLGECEDVALEYLAVARELIFRRYGVFPYSTQLMASLLFIDERMRPLDVGSEEKRGLYLQVRTGEGKSLLLALTAGYFAMLGEKVDIVTSNSYLAARDALQFSEFYGELGVSVESFKRDGHEGTSHRDPAILYSTNHELIFGFLDSCITCRQFFGGRLRQVVLVDEVDNLLIDQGKETVRISESVTPRFSEAQIRAMMSFIDAEPVENIDAYRMMRTLLPKFRSAHPRFADVSDATLDVYLNGINSSRKKRKDVDYIIEVIKNEPRIVLVDQAATGRKKIRSQWQYGQHEAVTLRESLPLKPTDGLSAQMSHPDWIRRYDTLFCVSGTIGDRGDRDECKRIFGIGGYDVPSHRKSQRKDHPLVLFPTFDTWLNRITDAVMEEPDQPTIVSLDTIASSKRVFSHLRPLKSRIQLLNDANNYSFALDDVTEEDIVNTAGQSGVCTIATAVAGRGTDVKPRLEVLKIGGVRVIIGFLPETFRGEDQLRGRTGRQGAVGESYLFACAEHDEFLKKLADKSILQVSAMMSEFGPDSETTRRVLDFVRRAHNLVNSFRRQQNYLTSASACKLQEFFFTRRDDIANEIARHAEGTRAEAEDMTPIVHKACLAMWSNTLSDYEIRVDEHVANQRRNGEKKPSRIVQLDEMVKISLGVPYTEILRNHGSKLRTLMMGLYDHYATTLVHNYDRLAILKRREILERVENDFKDKVLDQMKGVQLELERKYLRRRDGFNGLKGFDGDSAVN